MTGLLLARRRRAMCVDDEAITLRLVSRLLERMDFDVVPFSDATTALAAYENGRFDLVITDIRMPGMDGLGFLRALRRLDLDVPVVVATGHATLDTAVRALREGASGMVVKPFTADEFIDEVKSALDQARVRHEAIQYRFVTPVLDGVAMALTAAIEARDLETGEHCRQLGVFGERVAILLDLPEEARTHIRIGGYLHDVGKIAIADRILLKPGALTEDEYLEMQRHSAIGEGIVGTHEAMREIASIVRHHHERFDGTGYPDRLAGEDIPIGARIIAVADAFSAMTSDRVYRWALSLDEAWAELRRHAGTQFDPAIVDLFGAAVDPEQRPAASRMVELSPADVHTDVVGS